MKETSEVLWLEEQECQIHYININIYIGEKKTLAQFDKTKINKPLITQFTVSHRSDSGSEANSTCCHKLEIK